MALLEVDGIETYYGNIKALKGVSLTVNKGEIVTLIGSNGAGKTTTLRTISGMLHPRQGRITLEGKRIDNQPPERMVHLGIAHSPEGRRIFRRMSVRENLELGAYLRRDRTVADDVDRVFALFPRLRERERQKAGTMSGGEQQMLAVARALMADPAVVILDEPSLGLAPKVVGEIVAVLATLRDEQGLAVLLVEQNVRAAFLVADRVVVMDRGVVVATGTPADLARDDRVRRAYLGGGTTSSSAVLEVVDRPAQPPGTAAEQTQQSRPRQRETDEHLE